MNLNYHIQIKSFIDGRISLITINLLFITLIILVIFTFHSSKVPINAKVNKAKQDCESFALAVKLHNKLESEEVKDFYMKELIGKYVQSDGWWLDPWKNKYKLNYKLGIIFSSGPDGIDYNSDDIIIKYK